MVVTVDGLLKSQIKAPIVRGCVASWVCSRGRGAVSMWNVWKLERLKVGELFIDSINKLKHLKLQGKCHHGHVTHWHWFEHVWYLVFINCSLIFPILIPHLHFHFQARLKEQRLSLSFHRLAPGRRRPRPTSKPTKENLPRRLSPSCRHSPCWLMKNCHAHDRLFFWGNLHTCLRIYIYILYIIYVINF